VQQVQSTIDKIVFFLATAAAVDDLPGAVVNINFSFLCHSQTR
jgi:hypothetical protein